MGSAINLLTSCEGDEVKILAQYNPGSESLVGKKDIGLCGCYHRPILKTRARVRVCVCVCSTCVRMCISVSAPSCSMLSVLLLTISFV